MAEVPLKSKKTLDELKNDVFDKIYEEINNQLFCQQAVEQKAEDSDTDFDSDDDSNGTLPSDRRLSQEAQDELKEAELSKYKSYFTTKLISHLEKLDLTKYMSAIKSESGELKFKDEFEYNQHLGMLGDMVETLKDYSETQYNQSIFIECIG